MKKDKKFLDDLRKKLTDFRKTKRLTQEEFGKILGLSKQTIANIETGKSNWDIDKLRKVSKEFQIPLGFLIDDESIDETGLLEVVARLDKDTRKSIKRLLKALDKVDAKKVNKIIALLKEFTD